MNVLDAYPHLKSASTNGPNGVANAFLRNLRGKRVAIYDTRTRIEGVLVAWDSYHFAVEVQGVLILVLKKQGMQVRALDPAPDRKHTIGPSQARRKDR